MSVSPTTIKNPSLNQIGPLLTKTQKTKGAKTNLLRVIQFATVIALNPFFMILVTSTGIYRLHPLFYGKAGQNIILILTTELYLGKNYLKQHSCSSVASPIGPPGPVKLPASLNSSATKDQTAAAPQGG